MADDEIALKLDVSEVKAAEWRKADMEADRRGAAAHTALDLIAHVDRQYRDMLATLNKATAAALAKGDTRTVIELNRERRLVVRNMEEHAARRGAYALPQVVSDSFAPDIAGLDITALARQLVLEVFTPETEDQAALDALEAMTADNIDPPDDDPDAVDHVKA